MSFTKEWIYRHPSDHSAVNHRIQVISLILQKNQDLLSRLIPKEIAEQRKTLDTRLQFFSHLFLESNELIDRTYDVHPTLWQHKKSLFVVLCDQISSNLQAAKQSLTTCPSSLIRNLEGLLQTLNVRSSEFDLFGIFKMVFLAE